MSVYSSCIYNYTMLEAIKIYFNRQKDEQTMITHTKEYYLVYTEHWRIDAFALWCWRRLLRVLWTARRSNQSILKEISPEYSLEGLMLKLKLQYFGYLKPRAGSFEKTLMLGKIEGRRRNDNEGWDGWMASQTQWTWVWFNSGSWWWTGRPGMLQSMGSQRVGHDWATELDWYTILLYIYIYLIFLSFFILLVGG